MIFTMQTILQTCSEFDGKVFWKNRFLKKSFLKVLTNQHFLIFCSILVTKIEQKTEKFGWEGPSKMIFFRKSVLPENFPIKF